MASRIESFRLVAVLVLSVLAVVVTSEQACPICGDADIYPGDLERTISARYVGTYTCRELYFRGMDGHIPSFMCAPLQDFMYGACKCDPSNPHPNDVEPPKQDPCWIPPGVDLPPDFNSNFPGCQQLTDPPKPTPPPTSSTQSPTAAPPTRTFAPTTADDSPLPLRKERTTGSDKRGFKMARPGSSPTGPPGNQFNRMMERFEPEEIGS
eukprot:scaffold2153_cov131-Cylindrotheca_fusiformis.AAC.2